ncbi:NAD(P)-dependent alcohol dehydrogenase [Reinekea marina]|uniref:NAD(P)-dependent alcohol dehydrogenase n=1 Tax=Reinekea marina TaxID=1310421 RepID=A0ABV7WS91_9GAMM
MTYRKYGPSSVLKVEEIARPNTKPEHYEICVRAAEVTKADCELRSFNFPVKWFWLPLRLAIGVFKPRNSVLGGYFSGTISKASESDSRFKVGDAVFGNTGMGFGAYGEFLKVSANNTMVKIPKSLSFEQAAAVPLGGLNALHFLNIVQLKAGQHILIVGAGGSIGLFAVQIALAKGARVSVVDKASKKVMLLKLGVEEFIDYQQSDVYAHKTQFDVVFSMVAQAPILKSLKLVKPCGIFVTGNPSFSDMLLSVILPIITGKKVLFRFAKESEHELHALVELVNEGKLMPIIDSILPMEKAGFAHEKVELEQRNGAVVLSLNNLTEE